MKIGFENEGALKERLRHEVIGRPIMGGIQVKKVYLTDDFAIHLLRKRGASSLTKGLREKVDGSKLLKFVDRFISRHQNVFLHSIKQNVKVILEVVRGNYSVLTKAKLGRTLNSLSLTVVLEDLVDPFIYLDRAWVWKRLLGVVPIPYLLQDIVVKYRNDRFLDSEIKTLVERNDIEQAKTLINEALALDEKIWARGRFNTDLVFLGNITIRNDKAVLRDLGAITDKKDVAEEFLINQTDEQVQKTVTRLSEIAPPELVQYYQQQAARIYSMENFRSKWKPS
ncbi:MAG: hypothetical protein OEY67_04960 [Gammaproteobacteria bacterium]|nr:hypothetical protein [Gammaproteobacteria bacterium]